jgi:hypothetical protein
MVPDSRQNTSALLHARQRVAAISEFVVITDTSVPDDPNVYEYDQLGLADKTGYLPIHETVLLELEIPIDADGYVYVNQHLDDGLKGPDVDVNGDGLVERYGKNTNEDAADPLTGLILIPELEDHTFKVCTGWAGDPLSLIGTTQSRTTSSRRTRV